MSFPLVNMDVFHSGVASHGQRPNSYYAGGLHTANDAESIDSDRRNVLDNDNPHQIVTFAPKERFRLGYFDVICLVLNRMIGTCSPRNGNSHGRPGFQIR